MKKDIEEAKMPLTYGDSFLVKKAIRDGLAGYEDTCVFLLLTIFITLLCSNITWSSSLNILFFSILLLLIQYLRIIEFGANKITHLKVKTVETTLINKKIDDYGNFIVENKFTTQDTYNLITPDTTVRRHFCHIPFIKSSYFIFKPVFEQVKVEILTEIYQKDEWIDIESLPQPDLIFEDTSGTSEPLIF